MRDAEPATSTGDDAWPHEPPYIHRWHIDEPSGPASLGVCNGCGAEKLFRNWLPDMDFRTNAEHRAAA